MQAHTCTPVHTRHPADPVHSQQAGKGAGCCNAGGGCLGGGDITLKLTGVTVHKAAFDPTQSCVAVTLQPTGRPQERSSCLAAEQRHKTVVSVSACEQAGLYKVGMVQGERSPKPHCVEAGVRLLRHHTGAAGMPDQAAPENNTQHAAVCHTLTTQQRALGADPS
jgi:hypothetical protein